MAHPEIKGLDEILRNITLYIEEMMVSLHNIQSVIINAKSRRSPTQAQFKEIRERISRYWESISELMKECHAFRAGVMRLPPLGPTSSKEELEEFVQESLQRHCKHFRDLTESLNRNRKEAKGQYEDKFKAAVRNSEVGKQSMEKFVIAEKGLWGEVTNLSQFLNKEMETCKRSLEIVNGHKRLDLNEVDNFFRRWERYNDTAMKAHLEIEKYRDAVVVHATGSSIPHVPTMTPQAPNRGVVEVEPVNESRISTTSLTPDAAIFSSLSELNDPETSITVFSNPTKHARNDPSADTTLISIQPSVFDTPGPENLIRITRESFGIIRLWTSVSSDNQAMHKINTLLRAKSNHFFASIAESYINADAGYESAAEAAYLGKTLLHRENSEETRQDLIVEMQSKAQKAHETGKTMAEMFRNNKDEFNTVIREINDAIDNMKDESTKMRTNQIKVQREAEIWGDIAAKLLPIENKRKNVKPKDKGIVEEKTADKDTSKVTRNPLHVTRALLFLPITLPLVIIAKSNQASLALQAHELSDKIVHIEKDIKDLENIQQELVRLTEKMDTMASCWYTMYITLKEIHRRVDDLRNDAILQLKMKSLASEWNQVENQYGTYMIEVKRQRDLNPAFRAVIDHDREYLAILNK